MIGASKCFSAIKHATKWGYILHEKYVRQEHVENLTPSWIIIFLKQVNLIKSNLDFNLEISLSKYSKIYLFTGFKKLLRTPLNFSLLKIASLIFVSILLLT